jgi:hypothetical protein
MRFVRTLTQIAVALRLCGYVFRHTDTTQKGESMDTETLRTRRALRSVVAAIIAACTFGIGAGSLSAQTCPFDDGNSALTREGLVLTRYALGLRGAPLVAGTDFLSTDAPNVELTIACPSCGLDINGSGDFDVVDATIISRKLAGLTGTALTDGLALGSGTRNTPAAVNSFLLAGCGTTGGTVTSITAGTGLSGGTITATGTIGIAPGGVGNAEIAAGAVTGSKIGVGAVSTPQLGTASVTLQKLADGDNSQAGYLLSATGTASSGGLTWVPPPPTPSLSCVNGPSDSATLGPAESGCATSTCPAGTTVVSGGKSATGWTSDAALASSAQSSNFASGNGWRVCYLNRAASGSITFEVRARCCAVD